MHGAPAQPALVCLHGFLGRGADWLRIAKILARERACFMPDLPGHGANTRLPLDAPLHFDALNAGLLALLDALELPQTHLLGYSMGGRAALYFAAHHPERVTSLTLESASPGIADPDERRARAAEDDRRAASILNRGLAAFVEHWYSLPLFRSLEAHPLLRAEIVARRKVNHPGWAAKAIRELSPGRQPPVWNRLSNLKMPVLLVAGSLDEKYVRLGQQMAARLPRARLEVVPAAGHAVHLEQPARFARLLREFLKEADTIPPL